MAFARITWWKFKSGMREEGVKRMNEHLDEIKNQGGYMGIAILTSMSNPDRVTVVSFWDSEQAMSSIQGGLFKRMTDNLSDIMTEPPQQANQMVKTIDVAKIYA